MCLCENVEWDGRAQLNVKIFVSLEGSVHSFSSCLFIATNITNFDTVSMKRTRIVQSVLSCSKFIPDIRGFSQIGNQFRSRL